MILRKGPAHLQPDQPRWSSNHGPGAARGSADQIIEGQGLKQVTGSSAIEKMLDPVLA